MNILLTNDDGIHAPGLLALHTALKKNHKVSVVAPESEQSAVGHSITLADPIRVKEVRKNGSFFGYALTGTPADCVRLGLGELAAPAPELVISGINLGANVGINILYSGTVSAATEAAILGLPSVAASLNTYSKPDFSYAAAFINRLAGRLKEISPAPGASLNVNIPNLPGKEIKGVAWARQSIKPSGEKFTRRVDPRENVYYWRGREIPPRRPDPESDFALLNQGYVTITPLRYDMTHGSELDRLSEYNIVP